MKRVRTTNCRHSGVSRSKGRRQRKRKTRRMLWRRICWLVFVFFLSFGIGCASNFLYHLVLKPDPKSYAVREYGDPTTKIYARNISFTKAAPDEIWEANYRNLRSLDSSTYYRLSDQQKLDYLALLGRIEIYRLTGEEDTKIRFCTLSMDSPDGYYSESKNEIAISDVELQDLYEALDIIFHEVKHYHQHRVVKAFSSKQLSDPLIQNLGLINFKVSEWADNFEDYHNAYDEWGLITNESFDRYANQEIEKDSRNFANQRTNEFLDFMRTYSE